MVPDALPPDLLESLLWAPRQGYFLLDLHLERLARSARDLGHTCAIRDVQRRLAEHAARLTGARKVRLTLSVTGRIEVTDQSLEVGAGALVDPIRVGLARTRVRSDDPRLIHKIVDRSVYAEALASRPDCDDVLLVNERGEITEGSSSNVVLVWAGQRFTPPISCGLLPGTYRQDLLRRGDVAERAFGMECLARCAEVYLVNSVRRWRRATLVGPA